MNSTKILLSAFIVFLLASCKNGDKTAVKNEINYVKTREIADLWYRYSAEKKAIYYQTYKLAQIALDNNKANHQAMSSNRKKPAVVLDIDETVLDNSPQQLKMLELGQSYTRESWVEWVKLAKAEPLAGSIEFTQYAQNNGVEVFYVSNRYAENLEYTIKNLKKYNYPNADKEHVLLREKTSDKTKRREIISQNYDIILLLGDNLRDFSEKFGKRNKADLGASVVKENKALFGTAYIVFPNPTYGEWEKAMYNNSFKWSEKQRDSLRKLLIKPGY